MLQEIEKDWRWLGNETGAPGGTNDATKLGTSVAIGMICDIVLWNMSRFLHVVEENGGGIGNRCYHVEGNRKTLVLVR